MVQDRPETSQRRAGRRRRFPLPAPAAFRRTPIRIQCLLCAAPERYDVSRVASCKQSGGMQAERRHASSAAACKQSGALGAPAAGVVPLRCAGSRSVGRRSQPRRLLHSAAAATLPALDVCRRGCFLGLRPRRPHRQPPPSDDGPRLPAHALRIEPQHPAAAAV